MLSAVQSPEAAFVAGVVTSLHCAGMCGPLVCGMVRDPARDGGLGAVGYHGARVLGYGALGALAAAVGAMPLSLLGEGARLALPWAMVGFFLVLALRADRLLPKAGFVGRLYLRLAGRVQRLPAAWRGVGLGLVTPLLPCGPLYLILSLAAFAAHPLRGAELMLAFGAGTVPLLWLLQSRADWLRAKLPGPWLGRIQQGLAWACAGLLVWRLRAGLGFEGPSVDSFLCH